MNPEVALRADELIREFYIDHFEKVYKFILKMVGQRQTAHDLTQDTFVKCHNELIKGKEIRAPKSYLYVIAHRLVIDRLRRKALAHIDTYSDEDLYPGSMTPEQICISDQEFESLIHCIATLPERQREVFILKKIEGYSCKEIGQHLGTSSETVRKQAAEAFKRILKAKKCIH